jgi:hypothetical protein
MIELAGMDAYIFLRYLKMYASLFIFVTFFSGAVLLPVYGGMKSNGETAGINRYSMSNITLGKDELWTSVVFAYLFVFTFLGSSSY